MNYEIHITAAAERDMARALDYIEFVLKNPQAADNLLDEADAQVSVLSSFPAKFSLVDDPILSAWGIRFTLVKNYLAFYIISEEANQVIVIRYLYGKSNWMSILKQGFSLI